MDKHEVVFSVHYGINRFNPDGTPRCGDIGFAGFFENVDEAIEEARRCFDAQIEEMKKMSQL